MCDARKGHEEFKNAQLFLVIREGSPQRRNKLLLFRLRYSGLTGTQGRVCLCVRPAPEFPTVSKQSSWKSTEKMGILSQSAFGAERLPHCLLQPPLVDGNDKKSGYCMQRRHAKWAHTNDNLLSSLRAQSLDRCDGLCGVILKMEKTHVPRSKFEKLPKRIYTTVCCSTLE